MYGLSVRVHILPLRESNTENIFRNVEVFMHRKMSYFMLAPMSFRLIFHLHSLTCDSYTVFVNTIPAEAIFKRFSFQSGWLYKICASKGSVSAPMVFHS